MIEKVDRIWLVRPNLGNPFILAPDDLKHFTITIAYRKPWNQKEDTVEWPKSSHDLFLQFRAAIYFGVQAGYNFIPFKVLSAHGYKRHPEYHDNYSDVKHAITSEQQQYRNNFRWEVQLDVGLEESAIERIKRHNGGWPSLLDIKSRTHSNGRINYHSLYIHMGFKNSADFTILQITDTHIAKRYDKIPEILCSVRNEVECERLKRRYNNPNDNLRAFIHEANKRIQNGEKIIVVITGDITDYYFDGYSNGIWACGQGGSDDTRENLAKSSWDSNIKCFEKIITGSDSKSEALKCPIFTVIGNHEYYANEILLNFIFGVTADQYANIIPVVGSIIDALVDGTRERKEYGAFNLYQQEAREYDYYAYPTSGKRSIAYRKSFKEVLPQKRGSILHADLSDFSGDKSYWLIKPKSWILSQYLCEVNYDFDFELKIGTCHFLFLNTAHDIYPTKGELLADLTDEMHTPDNLSITVDYPHLPSMVRDFKEGGPHARGITPEHKKILNSALEQGGEKFIFIFTHAPFLGIEKAKTLGIECIYEDNLKKGFRERQKAQRWIKKLYGIDDNTLKRYGFLFNKKGFFKEGKRDPYLDFFCAEGCGEKSQFLPKIFPEFLNLLSQEVERTTDIPVLVFSGHTHKVHEFRVEKMGTGPRDFYKFYYYTDDYSGKYFSKKEDGATIFSRYLFLKGISPLLLTSDALKNKNPKYREIIVKGLSLASLEMKPIPSIKKTGNFSPGCELIFLRADNGEYVCAEGGGKRELVANRKEAKEWEIFELIHLGNNKVALKACNGMFVRAEGGGGGKLKPDRDWIRDHETFTLVQKGVNKIALCSHKGKYVCAEGGGGRELLANRNQAREWETFKKEKTHLILNAPSLISPKNGKVYNREVKSVTLRWGEEKGAVSYSLEIQLKRGSRWTNYDSVTDIQGSNFNLIIESAFFPFRWIVWAVGVENTPGPKSGWSYFDFRPTL
jgi:hypothetical protein